jgi:hypothetical protein
LTRTGIGPTQIHAFWQNNQPATSNSRVANECLGAVKVRGRLPSHDEHLGHANAVFHYRHSVWCDWEKTPDTPGDTGVDQMFRDRREFQRSCVGYIMWLFVAQEVDRQLTETAALCFEFK